VVAGAPYDGTSTFRKGSREAPAAIRWASESIETYSPTQHRDLDDLAFTDAGDLDLDGCPCDEAVARVRQTLAHVSGVPLMLGGEHTMTVGAVEAALEHHPDLGVIVLDAHLDLRDQYEGMMWSHATTLSRVLDRIPPNRIAVLGARSGTREEWTKAESLLAVSRSGSLDVRTWSVLSGRPLYITVDIDAFDPSIAPGTGNPEPLGLAVGEFVTLLSVVREANVVGCDIVEVSPPYDPSGQTAILAAWLVREMLLAFTR
jgi:agmatinase